MLQPPLRIISSIGIISNADAAAEGEADTGAEEVEPLRTIRRIDRAFPLGFLRLSCSSSHIRVTCDKILHSACFKR